VFYEKLDPKDPSFLFQSRITDNGPRRTVVSTYSDKDGKPVIVEETEIEGDRLVAYKYKQDQVNEAGEASFQGDKVNLTFVNSNGKSETDSEDYDPTMTVAPMIQGILQRRWAEIEAGDSIKIRYLAIERLETIGFKFFKNGERVVNGKTLVDIKMKPSSIFIAALVDPIIITVMKDEPHWIVQSDGRTPIRVSAKQPPTNREDWKAIDARVEYDAPVEVAAVQPAPASLPPSPPPAGKKP
jgi:hypothetical protein